MTPSQLVRVFIAGIAVLCAASCSTSQPNHDIDRLRIETMKFGKYTPFRTDSEAPKAKYRDPRELSCEKYDSTSKAKARTDALAAQGYTLLGKSSYTGQPVDTWSLRCLASLHGGDIAVASAEYRPDEVRIAVVPRVIGEIGSATAYGAHSFSDGTFATSTYELPRRTITTDEMIRYHPHLNTAWILRAPPDEPNQTNQKRSP